MIFRRSSTSSARMSFRRSILLSKISSRCSSSIFAPLRQGECSTLRCTFIIKSSIPLYFIEIAYSTYHCTGKIMLAPYQRGCFHILKIPSWFAAPFASGFRGRPSLELPFERYLEGPFIAQHRPIPLNSVTVGIFGVVRFDTSLNSDTNSHLMIARTALPPISGQCSSFGCQTRPQWPNIASRAHTHGCTPIKVSLNTRCELNKCLHAAT